MFCLKSALHTIDQHICGPWLGLHGTLNILPILPAWLNLVAMREAHELTEGSELAVVDDCGHSTYFEKPDVFNHLVMDFLARRLA